MTKIEIIKTAVTSVVAIAVAGVTAYIVANSQVAVLNSKVKGLSSIDGVYRQLAILDTKTKELGTLNASAKNNSDDVEVIRTTANETEATDRRISSLFNQIPDLARRISDVSSKMSAIEANQRDFRRSIGQLKDDARKLNSALKDYSGPIQAGTRMASQLSSIERRLREVERKD